MNIDAATSILNNAIQVILFASMPSVGLGLIVGLMVAVFQAVTQIQEQTLTFVPKMVVVLLVIGATFPWMFRIIMELTINLWNNIPLYSQ
ncbi:EscS/YscS/HrcS family type III secretion system export apparatus protein [Candidatus Marinamargulisbacteria bacterium SCGC AAA071-K20]|nr:EscS/YscS/HrcS family type III secretion system export apparatus protein [Candidatus Marinamargulisbacteria bacterium SCGC AAA071-K20]